MQNDFIGGLVVRILRKSSFNVRSKVIQSDSNLSFWIIRNEATNRWLEALVGSLCQYKDLRWIILGSEAFNIYTTQSVQKSFFVSLYENLFDWQLRPKYSRQRKQISEASCLRKKGNCSIWVISSDKLSIYRGSLFHLSNFLRQPVTVIGKLATQEMFWHTSGIILLIEIFFLVGFQDKNEWLTPLVVFLFMVNLAFYGCFFLLSNFPYMRKFFWKHLLQIFRHYLIYIATVKSVQSSHLFQTILSNHYCWIAFNVLKKNYIWILWYPNYKIQYCTSQEEMFSWNTVLYPMSQFLQRKHKMIWITIWLRSTAPQNLMWPSSVNFVIKSFQDFRFRST